MGRDRELEARAEAQLQANGFIVERQPRIASATAGLSRMRPDLLGWAAGDDGAVRPEVVVEVVSARRRPEQALSQLSMYAVLAQAKRAFVFDGDWHEADPTFQELLPSSAPSSSAPPSWATWPPHLVARLVWETASDLRDQGLPFVPVMESLLEHPKLAPVAESGTVGRITLARHAPRALVSQEGMFASGPLDDFMAHLLAAEPGWTVGDPWCGTGSRLLAVAQDGLSRDTELRLRGWEARPDLAEMAGSLLQFAGLDGEVAQHTWGEDDNSLPCDAVLAVPPIGRIRDRESRHRSMTAMAMSSIRGWLNGGVKRAVVAVPHNFLSSKQDARLREQLQSSGRLVAVVELPADAVEGLRLSWAVVVLERGKPGEGCLFARLGDDWREQGGQKGDFFGEYRSHLGAR